MFKLNWNIWFIALLVAIMCIMILYFWSRRVNNLVHEAGTEFQEICCILVTGKDDHRIQYARSAIHNFLNQTYPNKKLIIVNHHTTQSVLPSLDFSKWPDNVFEFKVSKDDLMLGDLRNIALELVSHDALWTTWDDDDYRSDHYLSDLYQAYTDSNAICVGFSNRMEYNNTNGFVWKSTLKTGFPHVLAKFDRRVRYLRKDTMEDVDLITQYASLGKVVILDNDPLLYIRTVHGNNTSLYVDAQKNTIVQGGKVYRESKATERESNHVKQIMSTYFRSNV